MENTGRVGETAVAIGINKWSISTVIRVVIVIIIIYSIISAWDDWIDSVVRKYFGLDKSLQGKFTFAAVITTIGIAIFLIFKIHPFHAMGINHKTVIKNGLSLA